MTNSEVLAGSKYSPILWLLGACCVGFSSSVLFAGILRLPRNLLLIPYVMLVGGFALIYFRTNHVPFRRFVTTRWKWGLAGALICGAFLAQNVMAQPASQASSRWNLVFDLLWAGVAYGIADALLLSVIPMDAVTIVAVTQERDASWARTLMCGLLALTGSLTVTVTYHLGYPEFRNSTVISPVIGNGMLAIGYLLTKNPIAPVGAHVMMHIAAVLHGPATTVLLPPHY